MGESLRKGPYQEDPPRIAAKFEEKGTI